MILDRLASLRSELQAAIDPVKALNLSRFFKSGPGQYAEGDVFIGVAVPTLRLIAGRYHDLDFTQLADLLNSPIHEERMMALILLVSSVQPRQPRTVDTAAAFYLARLDRVNNWDLVDLSCPSVLGPYYAGRDPAPLVRLTDSANLWHRRIAMVTTHFYIRAGDFDLAIEIATRLLHDRQDLIQKAVGWMLREIGKRDTDIETAFLSQHYHTMPRTTLRYAIEKFDPARRAAYLAGTAE